MHQKIVAGHGSGGKLMNEMIARLIKKTLGDDTIQLDDSAILELPAGKIAFTTDSFTVSPIFFPGGDIGRLAINGTVNDLAVMGARPLYISCSLILEEGLPIETLGTVLASMRSAADYAGVSIVTGDTKVVGKGHGDQLFINTSGIGVFDGPVQRQPVRAGDKIIVNGCIGDHGIAIMALRNNLSFSGKLESDCAALNHLIKKATAACPGSVRFIRDATRGGVASVLNEIVKGQTFGARLDEDRLPVRDEVRGVCDILGIEPLYAANEGKIVMIADASAADAIVAAMKTLPEGRDACIVGEITTEYAGIAYMETVIGGRRILPLLLEEQLPRIC